MKGWRKRIIACSITACLLAANAGPAVRAAEAEDSMPVSAVEDQTENGQADIDSEVQEEPAADSAETAETKETADRKDSTANVQSTETETGIPSVVYRTQVQTYGWEKEYARDGMVSGTMGKSKRLETIQVKVEGDASLGIQYRTHVQTYGWLDWTSDDEMNGTVGQSKRLEAIQMQLTGDDADKYDVYYRVHAQTYGWLAWAKNGEYAGTSEYSKRLEAIQIVIVPKNSGVPADKNGITSANSLAYIHKTHSWNDGEVIQEATYANKGVKSYTCNVCGFSKTGEYAKPYPVNVTYRTQVQTYGWRSAVKNGETGGTSGKGKRMETLNIKVSNPSNPNSDLNICYNAHVQTYGWQGDTDDVSTWKKNGENAGTVGQGKRLEAIQIVLTGDDAVNYDVYYRVHAQSYGWLGWAKNGEYAGTSGYSKRLEAIQIVVVEKDAEAPGSTENAYKKAEITELYEAGLTGTIDYYPTISRFHVAGNMIMTDGFFLVSKYKDHQLTDSYRTSRAVRTFELADDCEYWGGGGEAEPRRYTKEEILETCQELNGLWLRMTIKNGKVVEMYLSS